MPLPPTIANRGRRGFTLVELLIVLGIIILLVGILVPTLARVRQQAHAASTNAQIASLSAALQAYHADQRAFPGPVPNVQLGEPASGIDPASVGGTLGKMSMAENVYLGMLGGLEPLAGGGFRYNPSFAGSGPRWMGATPKKLPKYMDNADVSQGAYTDGNDTAADDTTIPEFIDRFPEAMPLLILRARVGAPGVASADALPGGDPDQQYDLEQVNSYTDSEIGVGRELPQDEVKGYTGKQAPFHGLHDVDPDACIGPPPPNPPGPAGLKEFYPYDLYAALIDPNVQRVTATAAAPANTARQKDGFIIISAGIDRVYGTDDDITNFGGF